MRRGLAVTLLALPLAGVVAGGLALGVAARGGGTASGQTGPDAPAPGSAPSGRPAPAASPVAIAQPATTGLAGAVTGVTGAFPAVVEAGYVSLRGGNFRSALAYEDIQGTVAIAPFRMMQRPVTNAEFLDFVQTHPEWGRDRVASVFAEPRYLDHWAGPRELGSDARPDQPVVQVSWFAAQAYCESQGARLPIWNEWEYAAAADETRPDARQDRIWRERILNWYSRPSNTALARAGLQLPNVYGVQDLHGLVWEWTEDFSSLMIAEDNRNQGDPDNARFCGAGALSMNDRDNYAVLMRVAMLSSLGARDTTANLGFRCVKDLP